LCLLVRRPLVILSQSQQEQTMNVQMSRRLPAGKKLILPPVVIIFALFGLADVTQASPVVPVQKPVATANSVKAPGLRRARFEIVGAGCPSCLMRIVRKIRELPGVADADLPIARPVVATVVYDPDMMNLSGVLRTALDGQYSAKNVTDLAVGK